MSESPREQTHRLWIRELQVLDDDASLDDVALAAGVVTSPWTVVAATGSIRPKPSVGGRKLTATKRPLEEGTLGPPRSRCARPALVPNENDKSGNDYRSPNYPCFRGFDPALNA